jgi:hypothetical protein
MHARVKARGRQLVTAAVGFAVRPSTSTARVIVIGSSDAYASASDGAAGSGSIDQNKPMGSIPWYDPASGGWRARSTVAVSSARNSTWERQAAPEPRRASALSVTR